MSLAYYSELNTRLSGIYSPEGVTGENDLTFFDTNFFCRELLRSMEKFSRSEAPKLNDALREELEAYEGLVCVLRLPSVRTVGGVVKEYQRGVQNLRERFSDLCKVEDVAGWRFSKEECSLFDERRKMIFARSRKVLHGLKKRIHTRECSSSEVLGMVKDYVYFLEDYLEIKKPSDEMNGPNRTDEDIVASALYECWFSENKVGIVSYDRDVRGLLRTAVEVASSENLGRSAKGLSARVDHYPLTVYAAFESLSGLSLGQVFSTQDIPDARRNFRFNLGEVDKNKVFTNGVRKRLFDLGKVLNRRP